MASSRRRPFGSLRKLPSGRLQARYVCPDCHGHHAAHITFTTATDADAWLAGIRTDIAREKYLCPVERKAKEAAEAAARQTFAAYAEWWLGNRRRPDGTPLRHRTRLLYRSMLDRELLPAFGATRLDQITRAQIKAWHGGLPSHRRTGNAHCYALLRTILGSAVDDDLLTVNPATIKGAGQTKRQRTIEPATVPQLEAIASGMPEPYRMAVLVAGWCALRFGEVAELRRRDVSADGSTLKVQRAMTYRDGRVVVGAPKSDAGRRDVTVPPHLHESLLRHLSLHARPGHDGLLFPSVRPPAGTCRCGYVGCTGGHLPGTTMFRWFGAAREVANRRDLRFHDLRHTGLTLAAHAGATLPDLMKRAGHSSVDAAQVYMHAARGRDAEIAARMSELLGGQRVVAAVHEQADTGSTPRDIPPQRN
ncbi:tyrosine-type recombinase/integrase [Nocardioides terrigena]|uniref:tyrosine-type recombinase/integrase n=1 Tax=Nocardioides terrigena TaxID=424797 RepID=UPI00131F4655|nr:site-specific integrase [Nocardioides terrigena]